MWLKFHKWIRQNVFIRVLFVSLHTMSKAYEAFSHILKACIYNYIINLENKTERI